MELSAVRPASFWWLLIITSLMVASVAAGLVYTLRGYIPAHWQVPVRALLFNVRIDDRVWVTMPDGVRLAGTLYRPRGASGPLATVFIRQPYDRRHYGEALGDAMFFARHGYAVLVQDVRGKFESEGEGFVPWRHATGDGVATLDWITQQSWSNGKVGTIGCSALGELQYSLARANHPAHAAMIPEAAGGAAGLLAGNADYFGSYEGGVMQLAGTAGWFSRHGSKLPHSGSPEVPGMAGMLGQVPVADLVQRARPGPNSYVDVVTTPLGDAGWNDLDYVTDADRITTPALVINTWGDPTIAGTLTISEATRRGSAQAGANQHVIIAPGNHCEHELIADTGRFGELPVRNAEQPYREWYLKWFDYWLLGKGDGLASLPPYLYFVIGEQRWLSSTTWPPVQSRHQRWYLRSGGKANGRDGDGTLGAQPDGSEHSDGYLYDPLDPAPSRGGPLCCSADPHALSGPVDQRDVETRNDVLVYTSEPLEAPMRIVGPLRAHLTVSSSAPDTDFVARLVHVWPDGRATNIQEGALRARYRDGIFCPTRMEPGQTYQLTVDMRSIAYLVPRGHRIRLDVTSSSFPRLERNLNTGGLNFDESVPARALNRVHLGGESGSYLELPVLATPEPEE
jgi:putative CocE/NonD family hydrolase